jgi:hypothetical protein
VEWGIFDKLDELRVDLLIVILIAIEDEILPGAIAIEAPFGRQGHFGNPSHTIEQARRHLHHHGDAQRRRQRQPLDRGIADVLRARRR